MDVSELKKGEEDELLVDVQESVSDETGLVTKTYHARWKVLKYEHLPEWLQDNEFLRYLFVVYSLPSAFRHGHRPPLPSVAECFKSILCLHSETINIWSHLLGMFFLSIRYALDHM